jgi:hypothetical protein
LKTQDAHIHLHQPLPVMLSVRIIALKCNPFWCDWGSIKLV